MTQLSTDIAVYLSPADLREALESDARIGLSAPHKWLPPKYFYDDLGSRLFDEITRLPEYYPTRAERELLRRYACEIVDAAGVDTLLELGSGSSEKTRVLLDAMATRQLRAYVPVDVSAGALRSAMDGLRADYPDIELQGAVADFDRHLNVLPAPGPRLVALLGGTIGNYSPDRRGRFLRGLADAMNPGEAFLLGVDLVKDPDRLVAAYDDSAGVTARFNLNVLRVLNRELTGDFDPNDFSHVAVWNGDEAWIEMRLRARRPVKAHLGAIGLDVCFAAGEELLTEVSAKFRPENVRAELAAAGFTPTGWWTDGDFALALARVS